MSQESRRKGAEVVAFLTSIMGTMPDMTTMETCIDAVMGQLPCPECGSTDVDPMASGLFCRDCGNYWKDPRAAKEAAKPSPAVPLAGPQGKA